MYVGPIVGFIWVIITLTKLKIVLPTNIVNNIPLCIITVILFNNSLFNSVPFIIELRYKISSSVNIGNNIKTTNVDNTETDKTTD